MNIVFVITLFPPHCLGGAEISTKILAETLSRRGHKITVYTHGNNTVRTVGTMVIKEIPEIVQSRPFRTLFHSTYAHILRTRLSKDNDFLSADIIHAADAYMISDLSGWIEIKEKLVATIRDYRLLCPASTLYFDNKICPNYCHNGKGFVCLKGQRNNCRKKITYSLRKYINDSVLHHIKNVICVSKYVENEVLKITPAVKTKIIGNPVSENWLSTRQNTHRDIDILYIGRLKEYKGINLLFNAISMFGKNSKRIHVTVIGEDQNDIYKNKLQTNKTEENVNFKGIIPYERIRSFYQRTKIVVIPSLWPEPFGRTVIEAMACGCAVVATNVGGIPEIISSKRYGILIPPNNPIILTNILLSLLHFPKKSMSIGSDAKKHVESTFAATLIAKTHEEYYESIIKGSS